MATRTWGGGSGLWTDPTQWLGDIAPLPDDTEVISAGTVSIPAGGSLDAANVLLGESEFAFTSATLALSGTALGSNVTIDGTGLAALSITGAVGDFGTIDASAAGGTFTIGTAALGATPGQLVLLGFGQLAVSNGDTLLLDGTIANHDTITVGAGSSFVNDGTVAQAGAAFEVESGGTLTGSGVFTIGRYSSLWFLAGAAPSAQSVRFTDAGGRLLLADPSIFTGQISNFQQGDLIDLTATLADSATYNAATGLLTVTDGGSVVATLNLQGPASGAMMTVSDGSGGTLIELPGTLTRVDYTIAGDDRAMDAEQVRAGMTTAAGTPITGAGVKIGIISNSFDANPGFGAADPANAAAIAGYLPLNAATDTCAVTVLNDATGSGDDNEGMAMAEEVYQVAPGAQLYFAAGGSSETGFASAISSLQAAGCQVIVDDLSFYDQPFFQVAGPADTAIETAIAAGVSYFTAAGNDGDASYQAAFAPQLVPLGTGFRQEQEEAEIFGNGTPYQTVTLLGGVTTTIALQWAAPYGSTSSALSMDLFDTDGTLVQQSQPAFGGAAEATLTFTPTQTTQYQLAIFGSLAAGTAFKYILFGSEGGGSTAGGTIDDPAADNAGTVMGQDLVPGVNAVGAIEFSDTPAFGASAYYTEDYSANGPAELLFDAFGNPLATPQVESGISFIAPVGSATSLSGFAPFDGTSAAAPNAAAVAALMLQADPALTPTQITAMLEQSADTLGLSADQQGAGLVQATQAVTRALDTARAGVVADFTGDGTSDILWSNASTGRVVEWLMTGGSISAASTLLADPTWTVVGSGDFTGNGTSDLLWQNTSTGTVVEWQMTNGTVSAGATLLTDPAWTVAGTGDFYGTGTDDILWQNASTGQVVAWEMSGFVRLTAATLLDDPTWSIVGTGDFTGSGTDDILWQNKSTGTVVEWLMNNGGASSGATLLTDPNWTVAGTGDFTGNGVDDILWRNASTGAVVEWLMNNGTVSSASTLLVDPNWNVAGVGDYTGNGTDDILWRNAGTGQTVEWLMNGGAPVSGASLLTDSAWAPVHALLA
jgi:aromatic ring-cleaving dioxygenase